MKTFLISIFSSALVLGVAAAQDSATPQPASPSSEAQTAAPAQPPTQQTAPATSTRSPQPQAPQAGATPAPAGAPKRIAPGSVLPVSLTKTIEAKKAKTGDEVVAKVTQDMKAASGEVLVPKDTKLVGHVTEAQPRSKEQKESQVGIAFDRAVMKNGSEVQLPMSIQAIIGPQNNNPNAAGANEQPTPSAGAGGGAPSGGASSGSSRAGMGGSTPAPSTSPAA